MLGSIVRSAVLRPSNSPPLHHRLLLFPIDDLPGFPVGGGIRQGPAILPLQFASARDALLHVERLENDRFHASRTMPPGFPGAKPEIRYAARKPSEYARIKAKDFRIFRPSEIDLARRPLEGMLAGGKIRMAKSDNRKAGRGARSHRDGRTRSSGLSWICAGLLAFLSVISFTPKDLTEIGFLDAFAKDRAHRREEPQFHRPLVGAVLGFAQVSLFGAAGYIVPVALIWFGVVKLVFDGRPWPRTMIGFAGPRPQRRGLHARPPRPCQGLPIPAKMAAGSPVACSETSSSCRADPEKSAR